MGTSPRVLVLAGIFLGAAALFFFDLLTPHGVADWVFYLPLILCPVWFKSSRLVLLVSILCSVFTVIGFFLSPPGIDYPWALLNRLICLSVIWLTASAGMVICNRSNQLDKVMASLQEEVAEHTRTEQALRASQDHLAAIFSTVVDAIITIDERGSIESVNRAAERLFGYSATEMIGRNVNMLMPSPYREEHDDFLENYRKTRIHKIIGIGREVRALRKDGVAFPVDLAVSEISNRRAYVGILRDISQRKEMEREVLEVAALEGRRIGQELHDGVGQELTGLGLMAGALVRQLPDEQPGKRIAVRLVELLDRVHGKVRDLSHGLISVEVEAEGLRAALEDLAARTSEQSGIPVVFDCPRPVLVPDHVASTQLLRIAQEAVSNALRHGQPQHIGLSLLAQPKEIRLTIQDDGIGIAVPSAANRGMGIHIMDYRAGLIGGMLQIGPASEGGTLVTCRIFMETDNGDG